MGESVDYGDELSVDRLIKFLKTAFQPRHFDEVGEILMAREKEWKEENGRLRSSKLAVEAKLKDLKELIAHVNGDRTAIQERERELLEEIHKREADGTELRAEIIDLRSIISKAEAAAAEWKNKFEDLEPEVIELKNNISKAEAAAAEWKDRFEDLKREIIELKNNKSKAEAAAAQWKNRYDDLEARISQLENDAKPLRKGPISKNIKEGLDANCTLPNHVKTEADCNENPCQLREDNSGSRGDLHRVFIEISDSDEDDRGDHITSEKSPWTSHSNRDDTKSGSFALKRKQDPQAENCCTKDNTQSSKQMCLREMTWHGKQMSVERTPQSRRSKFVFGDSEDSDSSSDSDSDQSDNEYISDVKSGRKWKSQIDMCLDFQTDPELCMDAVCALYRRKILTSSKHGGAKSDVARGNELAEFLIDGDQDGKRRKSKEELIEHDKNGIEDCWKIASIRYSEQLFNIVKKGEDPLFP